MIIINNLNCFIFLENSFVLFFSSYLYFTISFLFFYFRDPHFTRVRTSSGDSRMARNKNLQWDQYDPKYKKYLYIGKFFLLSRYKLIIRHEYDQAYSTMESKKWTYRYSYHNWQEKTPYLKFDSSKSGYRRFSMLRSLSFTFSRFFCQTLYLFVYRIM